MVNKNARIDLLHCLAQFEDWVQQAQAEEEAGVIRIRTGQPAVKGATPTHCPLFVTEWTEPDEDMLLAAQEAAKLGDIEFNDKGKHPDGPMVKITQQGYEKIRAYDAIEARPKT